MSAGNFYIDLSKHLDFHFISIRFRLFLPYLQHFQVQLRICHAPKAASAEHLHLLRSPERLRQGPAVDTGLGAVEALTLGTWQGKPRETMGSPSFKLSRHIPKKSKNRGRIHPDASLVETIFWPSAALELQVAEIVWMAGSTAARWAPAARLRGGQRPWNFSGRVSWLSLGGRASVACGVCWPNLVIVFLCFS